MCTLIALHRCVSGAPLVVAANRDEYYDRPAEGPALRRTPHGVVMTPLDVRGGGTWLGLNAFGLFAGLTNRRCDDPDPRRRSRGLLVQDALAARSAREAADRIEEHIVRNENDYNPFNLLVADAEHAVALEGGAGDRLRRVELGAGVHVIGNVALREQTPKLARLHARARRAARASADSVLESLAAICRTHDGNGDALAQPCVHTEHYGTRSSALLRLDRPGADDELPGAFRFADGAPCETEYEDFTPLLRALGRGPGVTTENPPRGPSVEANR